MENNFSIAYSEYVDNYILNMGASEKLIALLREKREFGLKKYKEKSYQSSLTNAVACDTAVHATDEMVDCLNYLGHEYYKATLNDDSKRTIQVTNLFEYALTLYEALIQYSENIKT